MINLDTDKLKLEEVQALVKQQNYLIRVADIAYDCYVTGLTEEQFFTKWLNVVPKSKPGESVVPNYDNNELKGGDENGENNT